MENEKLYIVIPAYNEQDNMIEVINDWYPIVEKYNGNQESRLVIIDDGSRDDTYAIMLECAKTRPLFQPLKKDNSGHGATVLYGYHYALEQGADYIFQTDSDGQTLPSEFPQFWEIRKSYDMVIGHRKNRDDGLSRVIVTKVLKVVIKLCFGITIPDANTPFRLMRRESLEENIKCVPDEFNLANVILSVVYARKGQRVRYIPITFRCRQGGVNSIHLKQISKIGIQALKDFKTINKALKNMIPG